MRSQTSAQFLRRAAASFNKLLQATRLGRLVFMFLRFICSFHFEAPAYRRVPELVR